MIFNYFKGTFLPENKSVIELRNDLFSILDKLQLCDEVNIYFDNSYKMLCVLLASLVLDKKPIIHSQYLQKSINDDNFDNLISKDYAIFQISNKVLDNIFYMKTSGSSGKPKMIEKTLNQILQEALFLKEKYNITDNDCFISSVSCNHFFGLIFKLFLPLVGGAKIYTQSFLLASDISNFNKPNIFITSPIILKSMNESNYMFNNINMIFSAGSRLDINIKKELQTKTKANIISIYGSTETGIIANDEKGYLSAFSKVKLSVDEEDRLIVNSPWANFKTNDLAILLDDEIRLLGRADRMIKYNDRRIYIDLLEDKLKEHYYILDCACSIYNDELVALLVMSDEAKVDFRKYGKKHIITQIKKYIYNDFKNCIKTYKIIDFIDRNSNSKITIDVFEKMFKKIIKPKFELIHNQGNNYIFKAILLPECYFFQGHFPNFAVLPGFLQLEMVFDLANKMGFNIYSTSCIKNLKFNGFLRPLDEILISIENYDEYILFTIKNNNKICASGKVML